MGFFRDYRQFIIELCLESSNPDSTPVFSSFRNPHKRYHRMYQDFEYFVNNEWEFDKDNEGWEKTFNITTGTFQGKYRCRVEFHEDYPNVPPGVFIRRIGKGNTSSHLTLGLQTSKVWDRKSVCVESIKGSNELRDKWWKPTMTVQAAIKMSLITLNGEIDKKAIKRGTLKNYKNSIFGEMEKLNFDRLKFIEFIKNIANTKKQINESWQWDELAFAFKNIDPGIKRQISRYFIKNKPQKENDNKSKNKTNSQKN